jgi:signal peptidase I
MKDVIKSLAKVLLASSIACGAYYGLYAQHIRTINGYSMYPTLISGEKVYCKENQSYQRGDVITFTNVEDGESWCKRVIGVEGDTIDIIASTNEVLLNGSILDETYINSNASYEKDLHVVVPENCIFVMGDNRNNSHDSREIGCINLANVEGKVSNIRVYKDKK